MLILAWAYFGIFVVFTSAHLYGSLKMRPSLRTGTKPVILLSILGMYLEYLHFKGVEPSMLVVLALLTGWLGDMLLMPHGTKWFIGGGVSFLASHLLFIFAYNESGIRFEAIPVQLIISTAVLYAALVAFIFMKLKKHLKKALFYPLLIYLAVNGAMNAFAWFRLMSGGVSLLVRATTGLGAMLFFISDAMLFFVRFDRECPVKSHFAVMLTYALGELLIVLGLMFEAVL